MSQTKHHQQQPRKGWLSRLKDGLSKTSKNLTDNITRLVNHRKLDDDVLESLEEVLIQADLGVETAAMIVDDLRSEKFNQDVSDEEIRTFFADKMTALLEPYVADLSDSIDDCCPKVITIVGVNGGGKTTTIGKLAAQFKEQGYTVRLGAADTFRAAAVEQLAVWAHRTEVPVTKGASRSDPASVAYQALKDAQTLKEDILLIDTAGRLHNKDNLMMELEKSIRVLKKLDSNAPHEVILVLDATVGQNAHQQVEAFKKHAHITGLVMTKLDSTAKGGVLISLTQKYHLPVYAIGVGEGINDLKAFNARDFARGLMGLP